MDALNIGAVGGSLRDQNRDILQSNSRLMPRDMQHTFDNISAAPKTTESENTAIINDVYSKQNKISNI